MHWSLNNIASQQLTIGVFYKCSENANIDFWLKSLFATINVPKFRDRIVKLRNSGEKELDIRAPEKEKHYC